MGDFFVGVEAFSDNLAGFQGNAFEYFYFFHSDSISYVGLALPNIMGASCVENDVFCSNAITFGSAKPTQAIEFVIIPT